MYRLYVDEVGTDDLIHLEKDRHRYLSLTGVAMRIDHARDYLVPALNSIKSSVFGHDPDDPIVFHRKEIMGLKGPYGCLADEAKRDLFNARILELFHDAEYTVFTALIDKVWMLKQRHWKKNHPYHWLMEILIERYTMFLESKNQIGDIMPEARLGKKDEFLQNAFRDLRKAGKKFISADRITSALRGDKLKFRTKKDNIAGLQLADLLAHPSHIYTRVEMAHDVNLGPFANQIIDILIEKKYSRSPTNKLLGYGIKGLP